ncbi:integrase core domain-containing protein [Anaerobranca gottschalkii]|uniref:Integrase core domain-containing protein n=1 Tax=Anaerobranca gottschalkii DSM 13577 TaxID=1120990 RepID=A0A1I0A379_9FIRM|nr:integrase core domain-containing protein [Anaerobranca gottschalkii]SES88425.1 Integrase core domain-containing protein [Anaerobranca gottschalkii DSM 13577]
MNAYIESFHVILEDECYSRNEFRDFAEAYQVIAEYMDYYNTRRIHSSINYMAYEAGDRNGVKGAKQAPALALDTIREPARINAGLWEVEIFRICLNAYEGSSRLLLLFV